MKPVTPEKLLKDVGRRLGEMRAERRLTQEELAERLGVGARYVQAIEAGRQNITLATVARFAAELRIAVAVLFEAPTTEPLKPGRPRGQR